MKSKNVIFALVSVFTIIAMTTTVSQSTETYVQMQDYQQHYIKTPICGNLTITCLAKKLGKIYVSQRFKFQINYPDNYVICGKNETSYSEQGFLSLCTKEEYRAIQEGKIIEGGEDISISVYKNHKRLSALDWVKKNNEHSIFNFRGNYKSFNFAGQPAISYTCECAYTTDEMIVFTNKNKQFVFVLTVGYESSSSQIRQDFKRIISTFKFTT